MAKQTMYGPNNPHPLSKLSTELVWEGKYDEYGNRREVVNPYPFSIPKFLLFKVAVVTIFTTSSCNVIAFTTDGSFA